MSAAQLTVGRSTVKEIGGGSMSIEGSLALAGLVLLALGVVVSVRRASVSSTDGMQAAGSGSGASPVDGDPAVTSTFGTVLLVTGVVVLLAAGVALVAAWVLFTGLF
jgi:hypothetical protein